MRALVALTVTMVAAGIVVWVLWSDSTAGEGIGLSLVGIASVIAVSMVFFAVGRSEDEARAADEAAREQREATGASPEAPPPDPSEDPHPRPALDRRRPMPPRRPN
jgi:outer membrane biosynthesis protein TonB